jgi:energy-coupling factor transporter ATP-binding protein EcfA2
MSAWDAYPEQYRSAEIQHILSAVRSGECVSLVGLSGAGKSNLMGFLFHRVPAQMGDQGPAFVLVDGNRAQPDNAAGLFGLAGQALQAETVSDGQDAMAALRAALQAKMEQSPRGLCLLFDRYDVLDEAQQAQTYGPLRALRDAFKYRLTYVIATRRPLAISSELAELFYANTLWLGPLSAADARWSARQYAARRAAVWEPRVIDRLVELSGAYPSLLRACCEAYAAGCALEISALSAHPAVQPRVQEFWNDAPTSEDVRRSGLAGHPLLSTAYPGVDARGADLTASEHRLLRYLESHPGQICAKDDLIRAVWPEEKQINGLRDDSLAQLIRRLRGKIGAERIETAPGRGYRYRAD